MTRSNIIADSLFSLLNQYGVSHIVCSPGSRNAALVQSAFNLDIFRFKVIVDERSAAFYALGLSMVSRQPVALVCTSGSALLNYAPAISEAYYQGIPLIVISADRPEEWIDQDDSQTIRQYGALNNFIKASCDLNAILKNDDLDYQWFATRMINEALSKSLAGKQGPVHINVHLDGQPVPRESGHQVSARKLEVINPVRRLGSSVIDDFAQLAANKKIMLVAGFMPLDDKVQKAVALLAELPNVCIMAETISNLHLPEDCFMVDTVLFPMDDERKNLLKPDILITIGGALISRKLKEFLRSYPPQFHWAIGYSDNFIDCFKALTSKLEIEPSSFLKSLAKRLKRYEDHEASGNEYRSQWQEFRRNRSVSFSDVKWSDLKAMGIILNSLPRETNLFLSNGTPVRYGQIVPYVPTHATFSNRGVSGIEGCTSTAAGCSAIYDKITCLITGDMSFGYDLAGLSPRLTSANMRIIVLDNGGGDIFRFIPATKNLTIRENFLCADQQPPVEALADAFGIEYFYAGNEEDLNANIEEFFHPGLAPKLLHINTRNSTNSEILTKYLYDELD